MPGHNHYADCTCGWCLKYGSGRRSKPLYWSEARTPSFTSYASFTIPNATCPVCGVSVFFYQSPTGGRVFFDELGPPWPKHPCTDNPRLPVSRLTPDSAPPRSRPTWRREGWEPIRIRSSRMETNWHLIPVENLITRLHFDALVDAPLIVHGEVCAFMKPWDANGWSEISFIELDGKVQATVIPIFERKRHFRMARSEVTARRNRTEAQ